MHPEPHFAFFGPPALHGLRSRFIHRLMSCRMRTREFEITASENPSFSVRCVLVSPERAEPLPLCLFLFGGGGSVENLVSLRPLLAEAFDTGLVAPMHIACAGVPPFCFYLDDPPHSAWETLVADHLVERARDTVDALPKAGIVGISMGGHGALNIAFRRPQRFGAVAAVAPMIEPSRKADGTPLRNRYHYPPVVPQRLLGPDRDPTLYANNHPVNLALANADEIAQTELPIRIDAGSRDALHAHDGAEYLHRALWDMNIRHEYELLRDADHVGHDLAARLMRAFAFVGLHLGPSEHAAPDPAAEALREQLRPAAFAARAQDPTFDRTYGRLREPLEKE